METAARPRMQRVHGRLYRLRKDAELPAPVSLLLESQTSPHLLPDFIITVKVNQKAKASGQKAGAQTRPTAIRSPTPQAKATFRPYEPVVLSRQCCTEALLFALQLGVLDMLDPIYSIQDFFREKR